MSENMKYRADIGGLRALAVILVICFHAKIVGFNAGFIGVDIFFVISGFLITSIILKEIKAGNFSFLNFYEKRIRRIFPALFFVLTITTVVGGILMMPQEFSGLGKSLTATSLFISNIIFWREAGYFDAAAALKPFLHTWSITIEEQFYLLFPLYLVISYSWFKRFFIPLTIIGLVLSFSLSLWTLSINKDMATFYLLPTRAWEFLIGSILAFGILPTINNVLIKNILSCIGLTLIIGANLLLSEGSRFPGANALYPTIGAFLLIYSGTNSTVGSQSIIEKILSLKALNFIGNISYSLYLWHWPIFVFASYYLMREFYFYEKFSLIILCFVFSVLSWKYVEQPFRKKDKTYNRKALFSISFFIILALSLTGYYIQKSGGMPERFSKEIQILSVVQKGPQTTYYQSKSFPWVAKWIGEYSEDKQNNPEFLIWGDSHANAVSPALHVIALKKGQTGLLVKQPGCMPSFGVTSADLSIECAQFNRDVKNLLEQFNIKKIILIARWSAYPKWISKTRNLKGTEESQQRFYELLANTTEYIQEKGIKLTLVTEAPKIKGVLVPSILGRTAYYRGTTKDLRHKTEDFITSQDHLFPLFEQLRKQYKTPIIHPYKALCSDTACNVIHDGKSLYYDDDHLSTYGATHIQKIFEDVL